MSIYDPTPTRIGVTAGVDTAGRALVAFHDWPGPPQPVPLPPGVVAPRQGTTVAVHYGVAGFPVAISALDSASPRPAPRATHVSGAAYTMQPTDGPIIADTTNAVMTLPPAPQAMGLYVVKAGATASNITVQAIAPQTIDGAATTVIAAAKGVVRLVSDGANWWLA